LTAAALWLFTGKTAPTPSAPARAVPTHAAAPAASPANAEPAPIEAPPPEVTRADGLPAAATVVPPEPQAAPASAVASRPAPSRPGARTATSVPEPQDKREPAPRRAELADGTVLVLQGIAITDGRPVALVNGVALGPGERVEGFTVQSIDAMRIELRRGDEIVTLALR
ncbi:MAG TPA: hypothetical protein VLA75_04610, partial [Thermoanaerobaculia bacterium]|nr:hypothetical protein [Thermoanaerobaculia bacterium]